MEALGLGEAIDRGASFRTIGTWQSASLVRLATTGQPEVTGRMGTMSNSDANRFWQNDSTYSGPALLGTANLARAKYQRPTNFIDADTIVIGTGIGGLTVASLLAQKEGEKVLLL
jgi:hypothetical protein